MISGSKFILGAAAALAISGMVRADDAKAPLQNLLDRAGVGNVITDNGFTTGGWVEMSTTWTLINKPTDDTIVGRAFDFEDADPTLNQVGWYLDKQTDYAKAWDIGGRVELLFGADARFTASNGMDFQTGPTPENQFDLTQAYVEVVLPVGKGLKTKMGKFITPLGYEYVNPTLNALYSHSFLFGIVPFSHTGFLSSYELTETGTLSVGMSRGWDQSLKDNNDDALNVIVSWSDVMGDQITYAVNVVVGPEATNDNYRTAIDFWTEYKASEELTIGANADYIYDSAQGQDSDASHVYGLAVYGKYAPKECKYASFNSRFEWFNDTSRVTGFDTVLYEATIGATITPLPDHEFGQFWKVRPEVRWDYAEEDIFDGGTENNQLTVALETVLTL